MRPQRAHRVPAKRHSAIDIAPHPTTLNADPLDRIARGREFRLHRYLGARTTTVAGRSGVLFRVWAPSARAVSVVGSFNGWDPARDPMRTLSAAGVWERFVPGAQAGGVYKFAVGGADGTTRLKADPFGYAMEVRPGNASVVSDVLPFAWGDDAWMRSRAVDTFQSRPISVYEAHLGSWRRGRGEAGFLTYAELADSLLPHVKDLGFTHLELLPITEHPLDQSWGYQAVGYFAPTSRHGTPDDFRAFVDRAHQMGLGIILDWVPAHFPEDDHALALFDGSYLFEHEDPQLGRHPDWGTLIYDYGDVRVQAFLISSALFWLEEFHVDALRVDAVASMLYLDYSRNEGQWEPNRFGGNENLEAVDFLVRLNRVVHEECPGCLTIAEESTAWPRVTQKKPGGSLGFDLKWNMGWMNDTLETMRTAATAREDSYDRLTFSIMYAFGEDYVLPLSHDEVVHLKGSLLTKMPGAEAERFADLRLLLGYQFMHPGKKLLFMGAEMGQLGEWNADTELEWALLEQPGHAELFEYVRALNELYASEPALHEMDGDPSGFEWIECHDPERAVLAFNRWDGERSAPVTMVANFGAESRSGYELRMPAPGAYRALLDSDSGEYGGLGVRDGAEWRTDATDQPPVLKISLPPRSICALRRVRS